MKVLPTGFQNLLKIEPSVFGDERGYFFESFNLRSFREKSGLDVEFVQDNESCSAKGILRGLHFQAPPYAQAKLVRVTKGAVLDVCVDLRTNSETFGKHYSIELNEQNKTALFIPEGFGHGFVSLEPDTIFTYKCSNYYHTDSERTLLWNDSALGIDWGITNPILSEKDKLGKPFSVIAEQGAFATLLQND